MIDELISDFVEDTCSAPVQKSVKLRLGRQLDAKEKIFIKVITKYQKVGKWAWTETFHEITTTLTFALLTSRREKKIQDSQCAARSLCLGLT